jgi:hypothetical protein
MRAVRLAPPSFDMHSPPHNLGARQLRQMPLDGALTAASAASSAAAGGAFYLLAATPVQEAIGAAGGGVPAMG